ncbi:activator of Hsp90 ATPase [Piptocephalis cylindrospora]|uniref:Activator of Hsp90 ATPase n=1 Tax=Piptocephalis cylindrospora TaxID=1907219 RepID=A0A4V1IY94_9FUNG|nr:activator of Hsp90 ATPase [Piptocephalis cylindrospora]|eukprot:RKP13769.1 activator of Hsp90 ATPase [Piptocephalis cylindrospora]
MASNQEQSNWKNVNNWHWTEKDCFPWAKTYLEQNLSGVKVVSSKDASVWAETTEVNKVTGDVDLHQRKGKIITLYDLAITINWKAETAAGKAVTGSLEIPEAMHDTDFDEYVFNVTVHNDSRETEDVRHLVRLELTKALRSRLSVFSKDLVAAHGKDVHIPEDQLRRTTLNNPAPAKEAVPTLKGAEAIRTGDKEKAKAVSTTKVKEVIDFTCSADDLAQCFLDEGRARIWSRGPVTLSGAEGSDFELFDGNVVGKLDRVVPGKEITQTWRFRSWPAGHYSKVKITLDQKSDSTTLTMEQTGVPVGEEESTRQNWRHYYFNGIKQAFGEPLELIGMASKGS